MKTLKVLCSVVAIVIAPVSSAQRVMSPDSLISLDFSIADGGVPCYSVTYRGECVIHQSALGFSVSDSDGYSRGMRKTGFTMSSNDTAWAPVWGENDSIRDNYNAMTVRLRNDIAGTAMNIEFRVYNDGVGFRYVFPKQRRRSLTVTDELTQFAMRCDMTAWWIPGDYDTQEYEYVRSRLSEIRSHNNGHIDNIAQCDFSPTGVQTSLMLRTDNGIYINIHEAALVDFPAMHLNLNDTTYVFTSWLTPDPHGNKAVIRLPFSTPWRAVMIADKATGILASNLILNLNEPCKIADVSWIKPVKYVGVWWEMITGKSTWSYCDATDIDLATFDYTEAKPHGRHGANNENVRRYIDFAADNGFDQVLVEGWNIGWEDWFGKEKDFVFDFVTPYPDFDIAALN